MGDLILYQSKLQATVSNVCFQTRPTKRLTVLLVHWSANRTGSNGIYFRRPGICQRVAKLRKNHDTVPLTILRRTNIEFIHTWAHLNYEHSL
jgi:hypothetical protein